MSEFFAPIGGIISLLEPGRRSESDVGPHAGAIKGISRKRSTCMLYSLLDAADRVAGKGGLV